MTPPRMVERARLRDMRLTIKPRVTKASYARGYNVERMTESNHPGIYRKAQTKLVNTYAEALALALEWAGPKTKETK